MTEQESKTWVTPEIDVLDIAEITEGNGVGANSADGNASS